METIEFNFVMPELGKPMEGALNICSIYPQVYEATKSSNYKRYIELYTSLKDGYQAAKGKIPPELLDLAYQVWGDFIKQRAELHLSASDFRFFLDEVD